MARQEPMVAVHHDDDGRAWVYVNAAPSGVDLPAHVQDAIHDLLVKYPVVVGAGDAMDSLGGETILSAHMTVDDARSAADEIATYLIQWRAGLSPDEPLAN